MQSGFILIDEFSRAVEGRTEGGESGKVSQETHSTTAVWELLSSLLTRQVMMLEACVGAEQGPNGLAEVGREPCFCPSVRVEVAHQIEGKRASYFSCSASQVDPFSASIILFVGRAWDAITDPLVGFCISKSPWTRLGRLMPW